MRLTCTACGAHGSIEQFTADTDARRAIELAAQMPGGVGPVAIRYLGLFRPRARGIAWSRVCKLLEELLAMLQAGAVEHYGRRYPVTSQLVADAMGQMLDRRERLSLPLDGHGYLVKILVGESPKAEAAAEVAENEAKRMASAVRTGSREAAVAEWCGEVAVRKRLRMEPATEAERIAFFLKLGHEP